MLMKRLFAYLAAALLIVAPASDNALALAPAQKPVVLSGVQSWSLPGSSADMFFARNAGSCTINRLAVPCASQISATRASTGMAQWADGHWSSFAANVPRITDQGLLVEEARTNLFLNSQAPVTQTVTVVSSSVYTVSVYGNASVVLSGATAGTVTQGNPKTFTAGSTSLVCTVSGAGGTFQNVQVELGGFATSPIVTAGSTVTRAADVITLAGAAKTAALNAKAARFVTNGASGSSPRLVSDTDGSNSVLYSGSAQVGVDIGAATKATANLPSGTTAGLVKSAVGFDSAGTSAVVNGSAKGTDATAWVGFGSSVYIGGISAGNRQLNGYLVRASFGPTKGMFDAMTTGSSAQ